MLDVVPLRFGTMFKKAFGDREVFCRFAGDVLGVPIEVDTVHQEFSYPQAVGAVKVEYDLFAEDVKHRVIVEVQHIRERDFFDRFLHYHAVSIVEQATRHDDYMAARTVFTLVVLTTEPRDERLRFSVAVSDVDPISEQGQRLGVYRHRLVFLNARVINDKTPPAARAWMELIAESLGGKVDESQYQSDPAKMRVLGAIRRESISPEELARVKDEAAWQGTLRDAEAKGELEALRGVVLSLAEAAGLVLGEGERGRIERCTDAAALRRWLLRVPGAKEAGEIFD